MRGRRLLWQGCVPPITHLLPKMPPNAASRDPTKTSAPKVQAEVHSREAQAVTDFMADGLPDVLDVVAKRLRKDEHWSNLVSKGDVVSPHTGWAMFRRCSCC